MTDDAPMLRLDRLIAAPVDHVWQVMIDRLEGWWFPKPWRAEAHAVEWRPGGRHLVAMHGPAGEEMTHEGVVLAFDPPHRFLLTDAFTAGWRPAAPFMVAEVALTPDGAGTRYTAPSATGPRRRWRSTARWASKPAGAPPPTSSRRSPKPRSRDARALTGSP